MMKYDKHDFQYIHKKSPEIKAAYADLMALLADVRKELDYTFQYKPIGSYARNMITYDCKGNTGYDFDINIYPNDDNEEYSPKELKLLFKAALDKYGMRYGYDPAEDSTRVLTIKVKDKVNSRILHSVDFAIVYDYEDNGQRRQQYVHFHKKAVYYAWEKQPKGYYLLPGKEKWLKDSCLWEEMRTRYIDLKNKNDDPNCRSRSLFAKAVHETCQKNGYFDR